MTEDTHVLVVDGPKVTRQFGDAKLPLWEAGQTCQVLGVSPTNPLKLVVLITAGGFQIKRTVDAEVLAWLQ